MKLSKAQQEVIDKMREGYELYHSCMHKNGDPLTFKKVASGTIKFLIKRGIIERMPMYPISYRLTEQYKNEQK